MGQSILKTGERWARAVVSKLISTRTGFLEDSFLKDQGGAGVGVGRFEMIQLHYIHYALYF